MGLTLLMMMTATMMRWMQSSLHSMFHSIPEVSFRQADTICRAINDLPVICCCFAQLVKQKTRFLVSFVFAGPDPRNDWDMTTLS